MKLFDGTNESGIYCIKFNNRWFYYLTSKDNKTIEYPPILQKGWLSKVLNSQAAIFRPSRKEAPTELVASSMPATTTTHAAAAVLTPEDEDEASPPQAKRLRTTFDAAAAAAAKNRSAQDIANQSYWESPEAMKLINPKDDDDTVKDTLEKRVELLCQP